jgi:thymidine kinase
MSLKLIVGCMFSGKSSEIIKEVNRLKVIEKSILCINSYLDKRYTNGNISTHDKNIINDTISVIKLNDLSYDFIKNYEYIIIDESQFFDDLYEFTYEMVNKYNKHLIVVGLNGDSNKQNFGNIYKLYPEADEIKLLKALCVYCKNGTEALFSKRIVDCDNQTDIGSSEKYIPLCRQCYNK